MAEQETQAEERLDLLNDQFRRPERNLWKDAFTQLIANRLAMGSIVVIFIVFFIAAFGPFLTPYDHLYQDWDNIAQPPTRLHPLGTDELGRDMLSRILAGGRTAIMVAVVTTTMAFVLGVLIGALGAYMGGYVDALVVRTIDFLQAFPHILLAVFLAATLKPTFIRFGDALVQQYGIRALGNTLYLDYLLIFAVLGITGWPNLARLVRGQVLSLRATEYVSSAQVVGAKEWRIIVHHLVPNALGPVIVSLSASFGGAMLTEASLSYLGLGIQPPGASWGMMIAENLVQWRYRPHLVVMPGMVLFVTVLAFTFLGDGLNDALNPRMLTPSGQK
ncbi:MAG: ABC transporter permease [Caldilineaceae bacterium]|nr:ABC transporter permease [Caldilineaceae bacterium]MDE0464123.1 ABC transporter permease [Caldilineaceae bacterium]